MLIVNGRFTKQKLTGVQRYAYEISSRIECKIISPEKDSEINGNLWEQIKLPALAGKRLLWSPGGIGPIIKRNQIITIHDTSVFDHPEWFSKKFVFKYKALVPTLARRSRLITTSSEFSKARIAEVFSINKNKIAVIPGGVDEVFFSASEDRKTQKKYVPNEKQYILTVASIDPRKNLQTLINAWSDIYHKHPSHVLLLVGGYSKGFSKVEIKKTKAPIIFTGRLSDNDLISLYKGASLFAYPSFYEGFGLPPLEAMAAGVPVVTSNIEAINEVVGDAAIKINPYSRNELANALTSLLCNKKLYNELKSKGNAQAKLFSWDSAAKKMQLFLDELAD